jgi:hypothetical protein
MGMHRQAKRHENCYRDTADGRSPHEIEEEPDPRRYFFASDGEIADDGQEVAVTAEGQDKMPGGIQTAR